MDTTAKTHENRVRRMAKRRGFRLERCARRDPQATDYGRYRLRKVGIWEPPEGPYGLTLDQAEAKLMGVGAFYRAEVGVHVDAERGSVITVKPGAVLDIAATGRLYRAEGDGSWRDVTDQRVEETAEWADAFTAPE